MISIKKYNHKLLYVWDHFVAKSVSGTIFHKQKFLNYHIIKKMKDCSLLFYDKNNLIALLPAAIVIDNQQKCLVSHPGASFGGFVYKKMSFNQSINILNALDGYCIKTHIQKIKIIAAPLNYISSKDEVFNYTFFLNKYLIKEHYISHSIYLDAHKQALPFLNKRKQRYIKNNYLNNKAYVFKRLHRVAPFYKILLNNKKLFNVLPTHSLKEIEKLLKLFPKNILLFGTYFKKNIIGGVLLLKTTKDTGLVFYNAIDNQYRGTQLGLFQIYKMISFSLKNNIKNLDLGVSHLPVGKNPLEPKKTLIQFKEQCGGVGTMRKVYAKEYKRIK